ncbi:hypothetical protein GCK72_003089 [Caenorhabditis remanei]|uniref:Uncharacterized protein n=1 Tax=Caenorhabditis remanei TaxID=31234 RepID=A0A6A5HXM2_CAERE|nr:hypothetical protein GCK72_003089 [Caenorhabditis remanei]KAF1771263.1 hypothetical protein GCK72_003089 [Caenorhabditis remanei]
MLNQSKRNSYAHGVLNSHFKARKTFSSAAIRDIIYFAGKHRFSKTAGDEIFDLISKNCASQVGFHGEDFLEKLRKVLVENSRVAYFELENRVFKDQYTEMDHIGHCITGDMG